MRSLDDDTPTIETSCTLNGGAVITFDAPWTEQLDTPETNPVEYWLEVMPTANETDPD